MSDILLYTVYMFNSMETNTITSANPLIAEMPESEHIKETIK